MKTSFFVTIIAIVILFSVSGCNNGPNTASVSGIVTINGEKKEFVTITFFPQSGERPSIGYTNAEGEYFLRFTQDKKGCIPGQHIVRIEAFTDPENEYSQYLPAIYNGKAADNPDLNNVEVKKGRQTLNFEVKAAVKESGKAKM
jgi:hypothetical protein